MFSLRTSVCTLILTAGCVLSEAATTDSSGPGLDYSRLRLGRPGQGAGLLGPRFPQDVYAQPAFDVIYDEAHPIKRSAALDLLEGPSKQHTLFRSGPATAHLCHIPQPRIVPPWQEPHSAAAYLHQHLPADKANDSKTVEEALDQERQRVIVRGLELLEPFKEYCIYLKQPAEWFTYAFCHGKAVRQFRAKPETSVALMTAVQQYMEQQKDTETAGKGDYHLVGGITKPDNDRTTYKFAVTTAKGEESYVYVTLSEPWEDKSSDSYLLGKWNKGVERVAGTDYHFSHWSTNSTVSPIDVSGTLSQGTELIEVVRLGTGEQQRYLSQSWVDGTRCDLNDERRMVEIQYHCAEEGAERIALIKEVTTCNYVLVVETPRLCAEPAFLVGRSDAAQYVTCREIVRDDWQPAPVPDDPLPNSSASTPSEPLAIDDSAQLVLTPGQDQEDTSTDDVPMTGTPSPPTETDTGAPKPDDKPSEQQPSTSTDGEIQTGQLGKGKKEGSEELLLTFLGLNEDGFEEEQDFVVAADELQALGLGHLLGLTEDGQDAEVEIGWDLFEYLQERERLNRHPGSSTDVPTTEASVSDAATTTAQSDSAPQHETSEAQSPDTILEDFFDWLKGDSRLVDVRDQEQAVERLTAALEASRRPRPNPDGEASTSQVVQKGAPEADPGQAGQGKPVEPSLPRQPPVPSLYDRISLFYAENGENSAVPTELTDEDQNKKDSHSRSR